MLYQSYVYEIKQDVQILAGYRSNQDVSSRMTVNLMMFCNLGVSVK